MDKTACYTYILKGKMDYHYCGITNDIHKRYIDHNQGRSKSTRRNRPYLIKFLKEFPSRKEARQLEVTVKNTGVKKWYNKNIIFGNYPNMVITNLISGSKTHEYNQQSTMP